ncbi:MAG: hypothetical protein K6G42_10700 [Lachnospiraceae bacterium]|nr:hypothetical protein [Lachnospiraceae bacterium]
MNKKIRISIILIMTVMLLPIVGFEKKEVRLLHGNEKLIDLEQAIQTMPIGPTGNDDTSDDGDDGEQEPKSEKTTVSGDSAYESKKTVRSKTYVISIRGIDVTLDEKPSSVEELRETLNRIKATDKAVLVDDYADSRIYEEVIGLLKDNNVTYEERESDR